ncbi:hypothetical protein G7Y89_g11369 [Cudoniella acicularis]|uniref:Uncharacterized protein n=1 Tax=Cudoniella acicularis TaxID=354080 RepID=A0A8H4W0P9_9HELO|nr:hypothetical protein G7Y89_g11369 [Cudoniella acicularis]
MATSTTQKYKRTSSWIESTTREHIAKRRATKPLTETTAVSKKANNCVYVVMAETMCPWSTLADTEIIEMYSDLQDANNRVRLEKVFIKEWNVKKPGSEPAREWKRPLPVVLLIAHNSTYFPENPIDIITDEVDERLGEAWANISEGESNMYHTMAGVRKQSVEKFWGKKWAAEETLEASLSKRQAVEPPSPSAIRDVVGALNEAIQRAHNRCLAHAERDDADADLHEMFMLDDTLWYEWRDEGGWGYAVKVDIEVVVKRGSEPTKDWGIDIGIPCPPKTDLDVEESDSQSTEGEERKQGSIRIIFGQSDPGKS